LTVSTFFAFGMSEVLPQNDADELPATLAGGFFVGETDGEGDTDRETEGVTEGTTAAEGTGDGTAAGAAAGAACGVRAAGAHPATRVTTDTAETLHTRRRTEAA
jgi:hypothetical protein